MPLPKYSVKAKRRRERLVTEIVSGKHNSIMDAAKATGMYEAKELDTTKGSTQVYRDARSLQARARIDAAYESAGLSIERRADLTRRNAEQGEDLRASNEALKLVALHRHELPDPKLKVDIGGEVKHCHLHAVLPAGQLQATLAAMRGDLAALPGPVVDAEVIVEEGRGGETFK